MNKPDGVMLTIPEAAAQLGIHEKRLRRLLARPEYRDRTQTGTRTTRSGERAVSLVSGALLSEIRTRLAVELAPAPQEAVGTANADSADADGDIRSGDTPGTGTRTETARTRTDAHLQQLASVYERVLQEKEARIAELSAALEHERGQSRHWREALAREQVLRALASPQDGMPAQDGPQAAPGSPEEGASADQGTEAGPEAGTPAQGQENKTSWWDRLWKKA